MTHNPHWHKYPVGGNPWSAEEDECLQTLKMRFTYREIAAQINRSPAAVGARIRLLSMTKEERQRYEAGKHRNRRKEESALTNHRADEMVVPDEVWTDRNRRINAGYRDLTAMICGDPRPGQSALDQKRALVLA